ncbi:MAG: hypothetical protein JW860_09980, partial [Sedimentisphaerales bacterium]|nr:hypothetical protein [Sedimentisphaerales bacterium]
MRSSVNSMVVLVLMVLVIGSPLYADDFHEGWEKAKIGMYIPTDHDYFILKADEGYWDVGDTIGTFPVPECQPTPQNAEIVTYNGSNALRLESVLTDCADNVWVALFESEPAKYNKGFSISLRPDTFISFEEVGNLDNPEIHGWTIDGCGLPPCYDNVSIILTDNRTSGRDLSDLGYTEEDLPNLTYSELMEILEYLEGGTQTSVLAYVLQRYPEAAPNTTHSNYREIFLDPNTGFYVRNLYDDFMTIPDFDPAGAKITSIEIQVDEHGWAIFDNIYIGNDAPEEPSQNDPGDVDRELDLACSIGKVKMPVSMLAGEEVAGKIQVIVTNQSAWPTADNQYMDLVIAMRAEDGSVDIVQETLEDQFIGGLKPYKSKKFNVNVNLDLPEGYYTLVATVVPVADSGMVTAIDAVDDVVRSVLPSQRDLIVEFSRLKLPSSVVAGESTKIKIPLVVTNNGNIPIAGGTTIDILIKARPVGIMDSSGDVILAEITDLSVSGLKPGKGK